MLYIRSSKPFKGAVVCIEVDNGTKSAPVYLHRDIAAKYGFVEGAAVTAPRVRAAMRDNERRRATERALYLLEGREYSRHELYEKLSHSYDEELCQEICDMCEEKGLIDDLSYAGALARRLYEANRYGISRIRQELYRRGIDKEYIRIAIDELERDDVAVISEILKQRYSDKLSDADDRKKTVNALLRRGFSYADIKKAINSVTGDM